MGTGTRVIRSIDFVFCLSEVKSLEEGRSEKGFGLEIAC